MTQLPFCVPGRSFFRGQHWSCSFRVFQKMSCKLLSFSCWMSKQNNQNIPTRNMLLFLPKSWNRKKWPNGRCLACLQKRHFLLPWSMAGKKNNQCVEYNVPGGFGCHCSSDISEILQVSYSKSSWEDRFLFPLVGYPTFWCGKCISGFCATQKKAIKSSFVRRSMAFHGQANICRTSVWRNWSWWITYSWQFFLKAPLTGRERKKM